MDMSRSSNVQPGTPLDRAGTGRGPDEGKPGQTGEKLLIVEDLRTYFFTRKGVAKAVDGVSFSVDRLETLGLVGESGCGKSATLFSILRLLPEPAGRIVGGRILLKGQDILRLSPSSMRRIRGCVAAMIPQDPMTSLDPLFSVGSQLSETIKLHLKLTGPAVRAKAEEMLQMVKIPSPKDRLLSYPHQLSGGMRQRVVGAIALACQPDLLLADEVTSALDVTIQAEFLALLKEIQQQLRAGLVFVTHDFGIVEHMCDKVAVMYAGKIVEEAPVRDLFDSPRHPYTVALLKAAPRLEEKSQRLAGIGGQPPPLYDLPVGCSFYPRCRVRGEACEGDPQRVMVGDGHWVSCWLYGGEK
jgi:oligopeptide transport system ATP-binding protein